MLGHVKKSYQETGKGTLLTPASFKQHYAWLSEVDSLALANAQMNLKEVSN
jgi:putative transposase